MLTKTNHVPDDLSRPRSVPIGSLLLFLLACGFYVTLLATATSHSSGGEAAFGEGIQAFFLTIALWVVLAMLLIAGGVMGEMPRWAAIAAGFLHPLSGVAAFVALDMCSRGIVLAVVFPLLLPALIALYAMWARLPRLHAALPPGPTSKAAWGLVLVLSIAPLILAAYF